MTESKPIMIDGRKCRYWFRLNPTDYRKCALRGKDDNCDEIKDCFIKKLLCKLALKTQECEELKKANDIKNELLAKLGCPTTATAKMKVHCLQEQLDQLKTENDELKLIREKLYKFNKELIEEKFEIHTKEIKAEQKLKRIRKICKPYTDLPIDEFVKILQIIDEEE